MHVHAVHEGSVITCALVNLESHDVHVHIQIMAAFLLPETYQSGYGLLKFLRNGRIWLELADGEVVLGRRQL